MSGLTHSTRIPDGNYDPTRLAPPSASREAAGYSAFHTTSVPAVVHVLSSAESSATRDGLYRVFAEALQDFVEIEFERFADRWQTETLFLSSYTEMVSAPAYLDMIGMGRKVVPLLLRRLERDPDHWFAALRATAKADPVPPEDRGAFDNMREAWLEWGHEQGLLGAG